MLRPTRLASALLGVALALALVVAACGGDDDSDDGASGVGGTATPPQGTPLEPKGTPDASLKLAFENGGTGFFWRTQDRFESVRAGQPYKVVLRVTNGYQEDTLRIVAVQGATSQEFEGVLSQPIGEDAPGAYYVFSITLPTPGPWTLTATAGRASSSFPVNVTPPQSPAP